MWTWTPAKSDWRYLLISWVWSNDSVLDYVQVKYSWRLNGYWLRLNNTTATISNSIIEENNWVWIYLDWTTTTTISDSIIRNNSTQWLYLTAWNITLTNNTISNNWLYWIYGNTNVTNNISNNTISNNWHNWIYFTTWTNTIDSNIISNNTNYWIRYAWTTNIYYNLFYENSAPIYEGTLDSTNITWLDPLYVPWTFELQSWSPAIDWWNPSFWLHPISWNRYDIWVNEYTWFLTLHYWAQITWIAWRNLTYEWSIISDPTDWVNSPIIYNATWNISEDWSIYAIFQVQRNGSYSIKLVIKQWELEVWSAINNFNITN